MKRRQFIQKMAGLSLTLPFVQSFANNSALLSPPKQKVVIGIGDAGINILDTFRNLPTFSQTSCRTIAVDWDGRSNPRDMNPRLMNFPDHDKILLGERQFTKNSIVAMDVKDGVINHNIYGIVNDIDAIKAALINDWSPAALDRVTPILNNAISLIVIAGLGRGTGSLIGPSLVQASMKAGIPTLGVWIAPFKFEGSNHDFYTWLVNNDMTGPCDCYIQSNDRGVVKLGDKYSLKRGVDLINSKIAEEIVLKEVARDRKQVPICTYPA